MPKNCNSLPDRIVLEKANLEPIEPGAASRATPFKLNQLNVMFLVFLSNIILVDRQLNNKETLIIAHSFKL